MDVKSQSQMKPSVALVPCVPPDCVGVAVLNDLKRQVSRLLPIHMEVGAEAVLPGGV